MKRYFIAVLLCLVCAFTYAQSVSFEDLLNLTSMNGAQAHDLLTISKGFKSLGMQPINGKSMDQYKISKTGPDKTEILSFGANVKGAKGNLSREVVYFTTQEADINSLLSQAKKTTLSLVFQGSDLNKNIYRFDNSLFRVTISLSFDKKYGNVEVQQKD